MRVISFPTWRVFSYVDHGGRNVIRAWLDQIGVPLVDRAALQSYIDMFENVGPHAIPGLISQLDDILCVLSGGRKRGIELKFIFCWGPFSETEITVLAGAHCERKGSRPTWRSA